MSVILDRSTVVLDSVHCFPQSAQMNRWIVQLFVPTGLFAPIKLFSVTNLTIMIAINMPVPMVKTWFCLFLLRLISGGEKTNDVIKILTLSETIRRMKKQPVLGRY